jgi:dynein heavy chain
MNVNMPKFTLIDTPLFVSITSDLFPQTHLPKTDYSQLQVAIEQTCTAEFLIATTNFTAKCFQLHETINVRHGLMCVGAAFSGKSKVIDTLARALGNVVV